MQQYRIRYLPAETTQFVDMAYKGVRTLGSLSEYPALEIKHIRPDGPNDDLRPEKY
jgi:hypothetical protein